MTMRAELNALLLDGTFTVAFKPFSAVEDDDLCLHIDAELVRDRFRNLFDGDAVVTAATLDVALGVDLKKTTVRCVPERLVIVLIKSKEKT